VIGTGFPLESGVLGQTRTINVCLPAGYEHRDEAFPVLYLIDGGVQQDLVPVAGFGALALAFPWVEPVMRYGGAAFLIAYGALAMRSALRGGAGLKAGDAARTGLAATLATVLALTWLNPHVYLDTVVLLGSISAQYPNRLMFGLGAICASGVFFFALGYGARLLQPLFARPRAWAVLDAGVGLTMWMIAIKLIVM